MLLLSVIAYLGGIFTIVSPCVLPVVPFVLARADRPFRRSTLPTLAGMALTFTLVATAAGVGGGWIVHANRYARVAAMALLGLFGVALLVPALAEWLARPLVQLGLRLHDGAHDGAGAATCAGGLLMGASVGFLWAPCAGPILGLVLTAAALGGASVRTASLLLLFAAGAVTSLGVATVAGGKVLNAMKRSSSAEGYVRRGLGVLVIAALVVIAMGWDTEVLAKVTLLNTAATEQWLVNRLRASGPNSRSEAPGESLDAFVGERRRSVPLARLGEMPELSGGTAWLNSPPLTRASLRGKVVLIDFWAFGCYNCRNALPYVKAYYSKYKDRGFLVIGVHTPEFPYEKDRKNVERALAELGVRYPVVMDNDYRIWNAFHNQYWPAAYYVDARGGVRYHHFGEGRYEEQEQVIQQLLAEGR
jgi:cytochrome c biogenesis protein CcdA/thiol-disulfide isomerase/thioredoxin